MSKNKTASTQTDGTGKDLDQLRDILYGNQARATEQRIYDLEERLEKIRQDLSENFNERLTALGDSTNTQFDANRKLFSEKLLAQNESQTSQSKGLQEKLDKATQELSQHTEKQFDETRKQLANFRAETRQRDDDLRQEMLALGAMLDKQKTGRFELGELLVQLGQQLQENIGETAVSTPDED